MRWNPDIRQFSGGTIEVPAGTGLVVGSVVAYAVPSADVDVFANRFEAESVDDRPAQEWRTGASSAQFVLASDGITQSRVGRFWYHRDDPDLYAPIPEVGQYLEGWAANVPIAAPTYRIVIQPTAIDFAEGAGVIWWSSETAGFEVPDLEPLITDLAHAPPIEGIAPPTYERAVILDAGAAPGSTVLSPLDDEVRRVNLVLRDADPGPIEPVTGGFRVGRIGFSPP